MQSATGSLPPLKPVPEPRVTTGSFAQVRFGVPPSGGFDTEPPEGETPNSPNVRLVWFASFRMAQTCSGVVANTTQPGICFKAAVPSKE